MDTGTARSISERVDVPRTRVYEATRVLEEQGLIEVQYSSPQRYRAIDYAEAVRMLRARFEARFEELHETLAELDDMATEDDEDATPQEVWGLRNKDAIRTRTTELLRNAVEEVVLVVGDVRVLTSELFDVLKDVAGRDIRVVVGTATAELRDRFEDGVPRATVFGSELAWLAAENDEPAVGRLLLVDRQALLASTVIETTSGVEEHAVFGSGFQNSMIVIVRRLLMSGTGLTIGPAD